MTVSGLAACGDSGSGGTNAPEDEGKTAGAVTDASAGDQTGTAPEGTKAGGAADPSDPYAGIDTSEPVEITMYVIGSEATDKDLVVEQINKRLQEKINATLDLQVIPLSESATRYPLVLSGGAHSTVESRCDRCLKPITLQVDIPVETLLAEELEDEENDEIVLLENGQVDLDALFTTACILGWDGKHLCREDCAGLCPRCGKDLNDGPCGCGKELDPRFAVLAKLLDKEPEGAKET